MSKSPAEREPVRPKPEDQPDSSAKPPKADVPPEVLAAVDEPLDPEREARVKAWLRGEGPDPWTASD